MNYKFCYEARSIYANGLAVGEVLILNKKYNMEAEDLLDKIAQDEGFGNWETVVLNCHHSFIYSLSVAAVHEALRQSHVSGELADFRQWAEEHYGIGYHDMVWQEWEKYHAANYR